MSKVTLILRALLEANIADGVPHVACTHIENVPDRDYGHVHLRFDDVGPSLSATSFGFDGSGEMLFRAWPNKWDFGGRMTDIFHGRSEELKEDLVGFVIAAMGRVGETLDIYRSPNPTDHYDRLISIWSSLDPVICDPLSGDQ